MAENRRKDQELYNALLDAEENGTRPIVVDTELTSLRDIIGYYSSRPQTFFRKGGFYEFAAFVEGFALGRGGRATEELTAFRQWLAARAYEANGAPRNLAWVSYVEQIYSDDERAFAEVPLLFDQFQSEYYTAL